MSCESALSLYGEENGSGSVGVWLYYESQRSQETVWGCAPFVPIYCEKPHGVGLPQGSVFLAERQCDAAL
jgi:hypothetical protein